MLEAMTKPFRDSGNTEDMHAYFGKLYEEGMTAHGLPIDMSREEQDYFWRNILYGKKFPEWLRVPDEAKEN